MDAIVNVRSTDLAPSISDNDLDRLIAIADKAKAQAYAPYSKFRVGAALLASSDEVYSGSNVENSSYGLSICAERTAVFKAVSSGERKFRAVVVTSDVCTHFTYPCGACRQVLSEFGDMDVICLQPNGKTSRTTLSELIPYAFDKSTLESGAGASEAT